jgi:hypothetical protein
MDTRKIAQLVDETINSMDGADRAEPAPYLLTRINAKMSMQPASAWERVSAFLSKPGIAFSLVLLLIMINLAIYGFGSRFDNSSLQGTQVSAEEYSMNGSSAIFDLENIQP